MLTLLPAPIGDGARARADDNYPVPPLDPGAGFEGIYPDPPRSPWLRVWGSTSPHGVRQVFNTPQTVMGQSFRADQPGIDWIAFVLQNRTQPGAQAADGVLRVHLFTTLNRSNGTLDGHVGTSAMAVIPADTTGWLVFPFARTLELSPGTTYYCRIEMIEGHPSWAGGRLQNFFSGGAAFGYLPNPAGGPPQNLNWEPYDLVFAWGVRRPLSEILGAPYLEWCQSLGLEDADPFGDPDNDGVATLREYLRAGDPLSGAHRGVVLPHWVEREGSRHLAVTLAVPAHAEYRPELDGSIRAGIGEVLSDTLRGTRDLPGSPTASVPLVEEATPLLPGLPALPATHVHRTFRLRDPVPPGASQGFVVDEIRVESPGFGGEGIPW